MKIRLFILLAMVVCSFASIAQKVTVRDMATFTPIAGAVISGDNNLQVQTDAAGVADISSLAGSSFLTLELVGYFSLSISFEDVQKSGVVYLTESDYYMKELVVSASRFEEKATDVAQQVQGISQKDMRFWSLQNTGDVLQATGNVFVQKSQMGGGSPILRGFEASRVLMVVDGVRMNNAIYRAGHLQDVITIDNNMLEKVEVVFGPGSVVYGSDALGGVMHFHTRNPEYSTNEKLLVKGGAYVRFSSANTENTGHIDFNLGGKKFSSLTSFTYSNFDDLRQGNVRNPFTQTYWTRPEYVERINGVDSIVVNRDPNVQVGSAYKQYDFLQKFGFKQSANVEHILNLQYSTSSDIPRYDRLTQYRSGKLRFAQWYYGPQERLFAAYELRLKNANRLYDEARIILSQQMIEQSRNTRLRGQTSLESQVEKVTVSALNADFMKTLIEKHELRYGAEFTYNDVKSTATAKDIETSEVTNIPTRYADGGSTMQSISAYITHSWEISPRLILTDGLRFSNVALNCNFNDKTFFPFPYNSIDVNNSGLNGNLGLVYRPNEELKLSLVGSTGYRVPNVDDMSKVFESVGATRDENGVLVELGSVVVPNPELKPERTYNVDFSVSKTFDRKVTLNGTGFYTIYQNALTTSPWTYNGASIIEYGGDSANVIALTNAAEGYLWGVNGMLTAIISDRFSFSSALNYTYGRITLEGQDESPLDHVPPVYGKTSFNLQMKRFRGEFFLMYNGWKRLEDYRLGAEDNEANATEFGMPAWYTLNIRTATQLTKNIGLQVSLENILDVNYRMFASNISAPGRNLSITLRANF
jgi:hemoglobin/transferrin/lactoferrin receptor protein